MTVFVVTQERIVLEVFSSLELAKKVWNSPSFRWIQLTSWTWENDEYCITQLEVTTLSNRSI